MKAWSNCTFVKGYLIKRGRLMKAYYTIKVDDTHRTRANPEV